MPHEEQKKNWSFRLGVTLVILSVPFFLSLTLIPFLSLEGRTKVVLSTVALISGEVTFWAGGLLVGKEVFGRFKKYLNPKNWFVKDREIVVLGSSDFHSFNWSGGTTKQLFIYPPDSDYKFRKFDFRISTASIIDEKTTFSTFPGFVRKLMVLDGEITLRHDSQEEKRLKKFDSCSFQGDWNTTSEGKGTDFNLMTNSSYDSDLSSLHLSSDEKYEVLLNQNRQWFFIYVVSGLISAPGSPEKYEARTGNMLLIKCKGRASVVITAQERSDLVFASITYSGLNQPTHDTLRVY